MASPPCVGSPVRGSAGISKSFLVLTEGAFPVPAEHDSSLWKSSAVADRWSPPTLGDTHSFKHSTSFSHDFIESLEASNPEVLVWLTSTPGVLFQGTLIFAYILSETLCSLLTSFALKPDPPPKFRPLPSSIVVMSSGLSIVISLLVSAGGMVCFEKARVLDALARAFGAVFKCRSILSYSLIAVLFSISKIFKKMAYAKVDARLVEVVDQVRLPCIAVMSSVILGKRYTGHDWLALLIIVMTVCSFFYAEIEHDKVTELHTWCRYPEHCFDETSYDLCALRVDGATLVGMAVKDNRNVNGTLHDISTFVVKASHTDWFGLMFRLLAIIFACSGSLRSEKLMKSTATTPFPIQNAHMEMTAFPVAIAMSFIVPLWIDTNDGNAIWWTKNEAEGSGEGFFQGYTYLTLIAIALDILLSWMGGIIIKQLSTLVKSLAKSSSMLLTVICTGTFLKPCQADPLPITMYSLAFVVAAGTVLFTTMPKRDSSSAPRSQGAAAQEVTGSR